MSAQTIHEPCKEKSHAKEQADFMAMVENHLQRVFCEDLPPGVGKPEVLIEAARHLCITKGAKRIRPRLTFLFGEALDIDFETLVRIAIAAELMHSASLLHDDVVDESMLRRGSETANAKWGNKTAVLTGDLVLALGLHQVKDLAHEVYTSAIEVIIEMTQATMMEVQARGNLDLTLEEWKKIAYGKTAILFSWCAKAPGILSNDSESAYRFAKCANHLGIAFQMADDIKDIFGLDKTKEKYSDIRNQNPNYVVTEIVQNDDSLKEEIGKLWQTETHRQQLVWVGKKLEQHQHISVILQKLRWEIDQGIKALGPYLESPCGVQLVEWMESLWGITEKGARV